MGRKHNNQIGWQPAFSEFEKPELQDYFSFEVYRNLSQAREDYPMVKEWIKIYGGDIENPEIIG